ncbi:MAG: ferrous iron transport protein A [Clostridiales bacterium]|nr:ferrous iron transport protein A [Clostridiales bacterium]
MLLSELKIGQTARIKKVGGEGALRLRFLDMGLIPKTQITLIKVAPMGDPIEVRLRGYELTMRVDEAKWIEVEAE